MVELIFPGNIIFELLFINFPDDRTVLCSKKYTLIKSREKICFKGYSKFYYCLNGVFIPISSDLYRLDHEDEFLVCESIRG